MPRKFTPQEERRIRRALREVGRSIMGIRGVRKTSIDELVRGAGISKGSFYRFHASKEALALELLAEWERDFHDGIEQRFLRDVPRGVDRCAELLASVILEDLPRRILETGMAGLLDPQEIAYLARAAGPREVNLMDEQDIRFFRRLSPLLLNAGLKRSVEEHVVVAGLRLVFDAAAGAGAMTGIHTTAGTGAMTAIAPAAVEPAESTESADFADTGPPGLTPHHFRAAFTHLLEGFLQRVFVEADNQDMSGGSP